MIYYTSPNCTVEWDENNKVVMFTRRGYNQGQIFREENIKMVDLIEQQQSAKLITDLQAMKVVSLEDQEWMTAVLVPRATIAGLKYEATVLPQSQIAKMSVENMRKPTQALWESANFASLEEALAWLKTK